MGHADTTLREDAATRALSLDEYWMPFTPNRDFKQDPKMVVRAEGMYYWNDRGDKILDGASGLFCVAAGHARREIADAVSAQLRQLDFVAPFTRGHPRQFELATRVAELTPGDLDHIFFTNSGSEAVDTAMKVALAYHQARGQGGRTMFVSRERAYHGVNFGGISLAGMVNNRRRVRAHAARHRAHAPHAHQAEPQDARRRRARRRARGRPRALRQPLRPREHRRVRRRADRGLDRLPRAARRATSRACASCATSTASCSCSTKSSRGSDAPARTSRRRASASRPTSSRWPRRSPTARSRWARSRCRRACTTRSSLRRRKARSSSSTATPTRAILPRAPRASPRSTSTRTTACSSAGARCRRTSRTRSSRSPTCRRSPTCAGTA